MVVRIQRRQGSCIHLVTERGTPEAVGGGVPLTLCAYTNCMYTEKLCVYTETVRIYKMGPKQTGVGE